MNWHSWTINAIWVFVGGATGTLGRVLLIGIVDQGATPWMILGVNLVGAGLLGLLVGATNARSGVRTQRSHAFFSIGLLGGFTSYSALAVDTITLSLTALPWLTIVYVTVTLGGGLVSSLIGLAAGSVIRSRRMPS